MVLTPTLVPILAGEHCIGHVIDRGRAGFEAFTHERSLGLYPTAAAAVVWLIAAASKPPEAA